MRLRVLMRTAPIVLAVACAVIAVPSASPTLRTYISGYLTPTYSANCYYGSSEACSGFNYWDYNIVQTGGSDGAGTYILAGFDTTTVIRGVRMYASQGPKYLTTAQFNMNAYARAMSILWVGNWMYVTGVACTNPDCS